MFLFFNYLLFARCTRGECKLLINMYIDYIFIIQINRYLSPSGDAQGGGPVGKGPPWGFLEEKLGLVCVYLTIMSLAIHIRSKSISTI